MNNTDTDVSSFSKFENTAEEIRAPLSAPTMGGPMNASVMRSAMEEPPARDTIRQEAAQDLNLKINVIGPRGQNVETKNVDGFDSAKVNRQFTPAGLEA